MIVILTLFNPFLAKEKPCSKAAGSPKIIIKLI
jgi:hypothetical protein